MTNATTKRSKWKPEQQNTVSGSKGEVVESFPRRGKYDAINGEDDGTEKVLKGVINACER